MPVNTLSTNRSRSTLQVQREMLRCLWVLGMMIVISSNAHLSITIKYTITTLKIDYIVKHVFKEYKSSILRKNPKFKLKWKNCDETQLLKISQFTNKMDIMDYLLDIIYGLETGKLTP